jgi:DNA polymerase III gamma/tau subunit
MRAFDLLANAEQEIRTASHPRYHFEMLLLKWMHTRKLVPLTELLASGGGGSTSQIPHPKSQTPSRSVANAPTPVKVAPSIPTTAKTPHSSHPEFRQPAEAGTAKAGIPNPDSGHLKDKFLAEIRSGKQMLYNTVVAQAQRIDVTGDRITFVFGPAHSSLRGLLDQQKPWLDATAERVAGRKIAVTSELYSAG